ncbi:MAG: TonB-dependent receptor [Alteromonadaceae bacterium]|nr:TonB-dependent receptor [Alteromonadaceae bacterium]
MNKFRPSMITAALAASGLVMATPLLAQDADEAPKKEEVEVIEVRGFSTSLIKSLNQKRFGDTVSEQLSADDLGGLPDVSMADALTRLPGISAVRTGGQAAEINIRGLSGDFVFSTLNGREQVSTSGDRSIEFDQYPSELISSAAVYKSPKASLIEGGVAGTVELVTASPLSNEQTHTFGLNVRGMTNDRSDEVSDNADFGSRLSFSYQGKYLDDTLGVALGYARLFQPSVATQYIGLAPGGTRTYEGQEVTMSEGFEMQHKGGEETRNGYMAALEWQPVDNFRLKSDFFLSRFDSEQFARGFRVKLEPNQASLANLTINPDGFVTGGTFTRNSSSATRVELVNDDNQDFDEVKSYGINAQWDISDDWSVSFDASYSSASSDFRNGLLWSNVAIDANADTAVFDENVQISYQNNGLDLPDIGFSQFDAFSDINRVMASKYGIYPYQNEDAIEAFRLDFKYLLDNNYIASIEFGMRYSDREYSSDRSVYEYGSDSGFPRNQPPLRLTSDMVEVVDWKGEFSYFPSYLSIDLDKALNAWFPSGIPQPVQTWGTSHPGVINSPTPGQGPNTSWSVTESGDVFEEVTSAYIMANIDTEIGDLPVTGNIGVRRVDTKQSSTVLRDVSEDILDDLGNVIDTRGNPENGAQYLTDEAGLINDWFALDIIGDEYTNYLPSLNLNFKISDNEQIRFAAAKVMGRPPINRLFANANVRVSDVFASVDEDTGDIVLTNPTAVINGSSTNSPFLRPFLANQFDISYERYFDDTDGAFVVALFHKDIQSFIDTFATNPYDFAANGFDVPTEVTVTVLDEDDEPVLDASGDPITVTVPTENGTYTTAVNNAEGGYIRGVEIAYTEIYSNLPGLWAGLGVNASYSYTESEITRTTGGGVFTSDLPGLSNQVATFTAFWEHNGFEARVSTRYRDPFVSQQVAVNEQVVNFDKEIVVDMQASYEINENLSVLFQANNVTDAPTKTYFGDESLTGTIQYFGTQYFLGMTYSL